MIKLSYHNSPTQVSKVTLPYSKSILNRLLILRINRKLTFKNQLLNDDIISMTRALEAIDNNQAVNAEEAGTVLRFSLAKAAITPTFHNRISGSAILMQRPIKPLIEALSYLGADISLYPDKLVVQGKELKGGRLRLEKQMSSQFISALMLIGHQMQNGLQLEWSGQQVSRSYIDLTADILKKVGVTFQTEPNGISIKPIQNFNPEQIPIEKDWSAASFFFGLAILSERVDIELTGLDKNSLQAECGLFNHLLEWGLLEEVVVKEGIRFRSTPNSVFPQDLNFENYPDAALNMIIAAALTRSEMTAIGLTSLNVKESRRLDLLVQTLQRINVKVKELGDGAIHINPSALKVPEGLVLDCHNDHRIAMAWALLASQQTVQLLGHSCVTKSFPYFWEEIEKVGFDSK